MVDKVTLEMLDARFARDARVALESK